MNLEKAIKTAIDYEKKIHGVYKEVCGNIHDASLRRLVQALEEDERHHVEYLEHKLEQWQSEGKITPENLKTAIPSKDVIAREVGRLQGKMSKGNMSDRKQILSRALALEIETSDHYRRMVSELPGEGKDLFSRFLEIEEAHITLVQAEFDYFSKTGYWFDIKEFDME